MEKKRSRKMIKGGGFEVRERRGYGFWGGGRWRRRVAGYGEGRRGLKKGCHLSGSVGVGVEKEEEEWRENNGGGGVECLALLVLARE